MVILIILGVILVSLIMFSIMSNMLDAGETYRDFRRWIETKFQLGISNTLNKYTKSMKPWSKMVTKIIVYFWFGLLYVLGGIASGFLVVRLYEMSGLKKLIYEKEEE